jgi:hypothetical protein
MKHFIAACMWLIVLSGNAGAGQVTKASSPKAYQDMTFSVFIPCAGNASFCAPTVLAKGVITDETANALESFILKNRKLPYSDRQYLANYTRVCFDSPGGSLEGGIKLGRVIRKMKLDTCLAPDYEESDNPAPTAFRDRGVICASACVLAISGGMNRSVQEGSRLGIHQFYSKSGQIGDGATQSTVVELAGYLESVGVSRRLLDLASLVPAQQIYWLDSKQIQSVALDNTVQPLSTWALRANSDGSVVAWVSQPIGQSDDANVTQFILARNPAGPILIIRGEFHDRFAKNVGEALTTLNSSDGRPNVWFRVNDRPVLARVVLWQADTTGKGIVTSIRLTRDEALALGSAKSLYFATSCPHALEQYSLDTELSTEGADGIFRAVLRP